MAPRETRSTGDSFMEGQWFVARHFFLIPNTKDVVANLERALRKVRQPGEMHRETKAGKRSDPMTRKAAEAMTRDIRTLIAKTAAFRTAIYNAQPHWSLRDIPLGSLGVTEFLQEFADFVKFTTATFCWPVGSITEQMEWHKHGWKHVSHSALCSFMDDEKTRLPPAMQADLLGTSEEFLKVVRDAVNLNPRAIARLEYCFPRREDLIEALEFATYDLNLIAATRELPTVGELAATWASTAIRDPNSAEAERARQDLQQLVSKGAALTSSSNGGRPTIHTHPNTILSVYQMSYCLVRQIHEVRLFIDEHTKPGTTLTSLLRYYPWLQEVSMNDPLSFLDRSPSDAAIQMSARILLMSPSTVSQTIYRH